MDMTQKAQILAKRLKRKNKRRSWREIAREDYNDAVNHATLCRIATQNGNYYPRDEQTQIVLGLKRERKQTQKQTPLIDMCASALLHALNHREEMPAPDPRVMKAFVKAGLLKRSWVSR